MLAEWVILLILAILGMVTHVFDRQTRVQKFHTKHRVVKCS